ncbi:MAG: helix-hairpin-helix domain-containing protein [Jatrophihabitantaceae bacterium]
MRATGRPGRGERGRVASRVRELIDGPRLGGGTALGGAEVGAADVGGAVDGFVGPADDGGGRAPWLPGEQLGPPLGRHAAGSSVAPERRRFSIDRLRWAPERRTAVAVALAVLVAGALTLWWVLSARPRELAVHASDPVPATVNTGGPTLSSSSTPSARSAADPGPSPPARLVVDVAGKVRRPGVYRIADGSRVVDALRAAGGALPGTSTTSLNLAEPLRDGQQVVVGLPGQAGAGGQGAGTGSGSAAPASSGAAVDLNAATLEQLQALPGVGPVLAQHILDWRTQHGRFTSVDQLNDVTGIGEVKFAALRSLVTV